MQNLASWYTQPLGQLLWQEEQKQCTQLLEKISCKPRCIKVLQLTDVIRNELLLDDSNAWQLVLQDNYADKTQSLYATADELPFLDACFDMVLLPHTLEFAQNPHRVLRESKRVLVAEGYVLIVGFNLYSLWGIAHITMQHRSQIPWCGNFFSLARIKDWLELLDFEICHIQHCFFRPPLQNQNFLQQLKRFDWIERYVPLLAADVIILAKKRVFPLTPIKPRWQTATSVFTDGVIAEPSTRNFK